MALRLKRNGFTRVRPLAGGLNRWLEQKLPVEKLIMDRDGGQEG